MADAAAKASGSAAARTTQRRVAENVGEWGIEDLGFGRRET